MNPRGLLALDRLAQSDQVCQVIAWATLAVVGSQRQTWREIVSFLLALTFFAQSYLIQSHIHATFDQGPAPAWSSASHDGDNPADCPICQADMLGGVYVTPSIPQLPPVLSQSWAGPHPADDALQTLPPRHSWQGRAPPHS